MATALLQDVKRIDWEKVTGGMGRKFGKGAPEPCLEVMRDVFGFWLLVPDGTETVTWWLEIYSGPAFRPWELQKYLDAKIPEALKIAVRAVIAAFDQIKVFVQNHRGTEKCLGELPEWEQIRVLSGCISRVMEGIRAVPGVLIE